MKHATLILLVLLIPAKVSWGCANYFYGTTKDGHSYDMGYNWKTPYPLNFNQERHVALLKALKIKLNKEHNYMLLSDYALSLLKLGKTQEALSIFKTLYTHFPNDYKITSNLGTAYELSGENDSALKYIRRTIVLNPNDHSGSEWIHVKILETKIALKKQPNYLQAHTVLDLSAKQKKDTAVLTHLAIQLQERMPFMANCALPEPIMGDLFCDLGDLCFELAAIEHANVYYQIAQKHFQYARADVAQKLKEIQSLRKKYANLKVSDANHIEGSVNRVSMFQYKSFLIDNSNKDFKPDWSKITTDVPSLLALVDFSKSEGVQKTEALDTIGKQADTLQYLQESSTPSAAETVSSVTETKVSSQSSSATLYIVAASLLVFVLLLVLRTYLGKK